MPSAEVPSESRIWASAGRLASQRRALAVPLRIGTGAHAVHVIAIAPCEYGGGARWHGRTRLRHAWTVVHWPARDELVSREHTELAVQAAREYLSRVLGRVTFAESERREVPRTPPPATKRVSSAAEKRALTAARFLALEREINAAREEALSKQRADAPAKRLSARKRKAPPDGG